ncbi:BEN domain-containing protein 5-like [Dermacentor albipictus]|uniref:BEN domain-containing protein 5-like n=1 Tax=Dermacentor albipictus TaxID=60249 RepID=UPI0038FD1243
MRVLVEYEVDMTTAVLEHTAVQNFHPANIADFDPTVRYDVWWNGDETTSGGYYKARVLHMAETEEDMTTHMSKRLRKPVVSLEKGKKRAKGKQVTQATKSMRVEVQQTVERELLAEIQDACPQQHVQCTCCEQGCVVLEELAKCKKETAEQSQQLEERRKQFEDVAEELRTLKEKMLILESRNAHLQDALASKVLASESRIIYATSLGVSVVAGPPGPTGAQGANDPVPLVQPRQATFSAKPRTTAAPATIVQPLSAGYLSEPRTAVAQAPSHPNAADCMSEPSTSCTQVQSTARASTPEPAPEDGFISEMPGMVPNDFADSDLFAEEEVMDVVIGSSRDDGKMYAGSGKWIDKAAWGTLFRASGDSMFCRMASTIYWTPDELRNRSVTGTLSNKSRSMGRTEARQAVTPEKLSSLKSLLRIFMGSDVTPEDEEKRMKSVRRHLAQKLADAQRK